MAIIITIMVLEFETPDSPEFAALAELRFTILSYIVSFIYIGIYWTNHHHVLHAADKITGSVLWLDLNLLFWLSLIPFTTAWMDEQLFADIPVALYGMTLLMSAVSYYLLRKEISRHQIPDSILREDQQSDVKLFISVTLYCVGILMSFFVPWVAVLLYVAAAVLWIVPEKRIEVSFG